jgi:hypothetical protein
MMTHSEMGEVVERATREIERMTDALNEILRWSEAYPLKVFPEADDAYLKKAHEVLTANGMTLDRISANAMRHVLTGVGRIARDALEQPA